MASVVSKRCAGSGFRTAALAGLLLLAASSSEAQPVAKQVLVLQSIDRGNMVLDYFTTNFRVEVDQQVEQPVNFLQVNVGPSGFVASSEQTVVDFIDPPTWIVPTRT